MINFKEFLESIAPAKINGKSSRYEDLLKEALVNLNRDLRIEFARYCINDVSNLITGKTSNIYHHFLSFHNVSLEELEDAGEQISVVARDTTVPTREYYALLSAYRLLCVIYGNDIDAAVTCAIFAMFAATHTFTFTGSDFQKDKIQEYIKIAESLNLQGKFDNPEQTLLNHLKNIIEAILTGDEDMATIYALIDTLSELENQPLINKAEKNIIFRLNSLISGSNYEEVIQKIHQNRILIARALENLLNK